MKLWDMLPLSDCYVREQPCLKGKCLLDENITLKDAMIVICMDSDICCVWLM